MFERNGLTPIIYGPYASTIDGRKRMVFVYAGGFKTTMAFSRYKWLTEKGPIPEGYEVDHVDENPLNDNIENLQLLTAIENIAKARAFGKYGFQELYYGLCDVCGKEFTKEMRNVRSNWKKGKAGPFCSRSCSGKYKAEMQYRGHTQIWSSGLT